MKLCQGARNATPTAISSANVANKPTNRPRLRIVSVSSSACSANICSVTALLLLLMTL